MTSDAAVLAFATDDTTTPITRPRVERAREAATRVTGPRRDEYLSMAKPFADDSHLSSTTKLKA